MPKVAIVTDSTVNLPHQLIERYQIQVAPQSLIWGQETFRDGVDIQPEEVYNRLETSKVIPTTSQATPAEFLRIYTSLLDQDYDILSVLISAKLSGTIQSALQANEMLNSNRIAIVDSTSTSMALGFQTLLVARAAEQGASLEECKTLAERSRDHIGLLFVVDTLKYLHLGGRIGGGARFLGTALNLKPILEVVNGRIEAIERVRTKRKAVDRILDLVEQRIGGRKPLYLAALHAKASGRGRQSARTRLPAAEPGRKLHDGGQPGRGRSCRTRRGWPGLPGRDVGFSILIITNSTNHTHLRGQPMKQFDSIGIQIPQTYLPRTGIDMQKWAVIACDQFTSEPEYWDQVARLVGDAPSTFHLVLPEVFLGKPEEQERVQTIQATMQRYLAEGILVPQDGFIYVERTVGSGRTRRGLLLALDLEKYDFNKGSQSLIRATEGTIIERLPPRIKIREGAPLELPHIIVLIDDPDCTVIEPLQEQKSHLKQDLRL